MTTNDRLAALSRGFRSRYLSNADVEAQLRAWAEAFPELVRVRSIGRSLDGQPLLVATIGRDPDRRRPSVWIDGNMHAVELAGSSVALAIAEDVIALHLADDADVASLARPVKSRLRDVIFHVMPRMCPDGVDAILSTGGYVRSNPRDRRSHKQHARWIAKDIDGDGLALVMRKEDRTGEYVASKEVSGVLLPREIDDEGPFYKLYPEGIIENFDGTTVPSPHFLSDNDVDLNRNFPWGWAPEPEQVGAGAYPTSEPEARAVVEFVTDHPEIFAWLNLHTFGGCFIRPLGHAADKEMTDNDRALWRQIGAWCEEITGYPMVSGFEEFLYEPDKPLHGDLSDFGYHQRGALAYVCELWDLFARIGMPRVKPFVDHYVQLTRAHIVQLARWDAKENAGRVFRPWKKAHHPQLGDVECGGLDLRVGISNPSFEALPEVCTRQSSAFLRVASLAPKIVVRSEVGAPSADGLRTIDVTIDNEGYLPTWIVENAKKLPFAEPLVIEATMSDGCALVDPLQRRREIGHLDGWGRGLFGEGTALFHMRSRGSCSRAVMRYVTRGRGVLMVRVGSCRTGWIDERIALG